MNKDVSNHHINNLYSKVLEMGANGGKILGAGNSGYFMINCDEKYQKNIIRYLMKFGYIEERINFTSKGISISTKKI